LPTVIYVIGYVSRQIKKVINAIMVECITLNV
jgi:hypothetical protein